MQTLNNETQNSIVFDGSAANEQMKSDSPD